MMDTDFPEASYSLDSSRKHIYFIALNMIPYSEKKYYLLSPFISSMYFQIFGRNQFFMSSTQMNSFLNENITMVKLLIIHGLPNN